MPHHLQAEARESAVGQAALLVSAGFEPVRYFFAMRRPNLDDQLDAPLPEGLEIREVRPEHLRAIWETEVEAVRDHWGATEPTEAGYQHFLTEASPEETALWRVAWDGDQIAGQVRSFILEEGNRRDGVQRGWVERIMVRRPWRHRGLARALMAASFPAAAGTRHDRGHARGRLARTHPARCACTRAWASCPSPGKRPTASRSDATAPSRRGRRSRPGQGESHLRATRRQVARLDRPAVGDDEVARDGQAEPGAR